MGNLPAKNIVLIAEDDPSDAALLQEALKRVPVEGIYKLVEDGEAVLDYLKGEGKYADRAQFPFPSILFLDLKMPKKNGFEVLEWIKTHPTCKVIPTIIFSSSSLEQDVWISYELGANSYLVKPASFTDLVRRMQLALEFWQVCALPALPHKVVSGA
jgi:DNA-binding response OmpR family regulator